MIIVVKNQRKEPSALLDREKPGSPLNCGKVSSVEQQDTRVSTEPSSTAINLEINPSRATVEVP